jgi:hypothetical protein
MRGKEKNIEKIMESMFALEWKKLKQENVMEFESLKKLILAKIATSNDIISKL